LNNATIELRKKDLPIYQEINKILRTAQMQAEAMLANERPDIRDTIETQRQVNNSMKQGNVPEEDPSLFPDREIIFQYGVGGSDKKNSSSWILQKWKK